MRKIIIVSADENGLIGNNGQLPWRIPEELKFFKQVTMGHPIIMGRKTWNSLPKKPLPGRFNIILTKSEMSRGENYTFVNNFDEALKTAVINLDVLGHVGNQVFIIGGAQIYKEALEKGYVDSIILSEVKGKYEGDTYFPKLDPNKWRKCLISKHKDFSVYEYEKLSNLV